MTTADTRLERARVALEGLSIERRQSREALPNWPFVEGFAAKTALYRPVGEAELALIVAKTQGLDTLALPG